MSASAVKVAHEVHGQGPPLLLIAGTAFPGATWNRETIEPLAHRNTVVTFDHRGTGGTAATSGPYSTRTFAADAARLVRELGLGAAHVLGHSMGGRVAQWMVIDHPDTVASLILAASGPGPFGDGRPHERAVPRRTRERIAALGYQGYIAAHIRETFFTPEYFAGHPDHVSWLVSAFWTHRPSLGDYLKHVAARQRHRTTHLLDRIGVRTLVLVGDRDTHEGGTGSHLLQSRFLADHLPRATLHVIVGAAHGLFWMSPEETVAAIGEWLGSRGEPIPRGRLTAASS